MRSCDRSESSDASMLPGSCESRAEVGEARGKGGGGYILVYKEAVGPWGGGGVTHVCRGLVIDH